MHVTCRANYTPPMLSASIFREEQKAHKNKINARRKTGMNMIRNERDIQGLKACSRV